MLKENLIKPLKFTKNLMTVGLLCTLFSQVATADIAVPFEAVYEVTIDGKPRLESRISLVKQGEQWRFESRSKGTRGLARFLKVSTNESSVGQWVDEQFVQTQFQHQSKIAGGGNQWTASFDWSSNQVTTRHEDGESILPMTAGTFDPMSMTLALRNQLIRESQTFSVRVVDETDIDVYEFRADEAEQLQTALGCFEVVAVHRVRENSTRYSAGWYAKKLDFMPLRLQHGKRGGKEFEMKIKSLTLDGQDISGLETCPS